MTPRTASFEKAEKILQAARRVLGRKGYARATISEVAKEAGVSRGLLHYYFKSKEEMLARVMRETVETTAGMTEILFRESKEPHVLARSIVNAMKAFVQNDPLFSSIFFESWGLARHSETVDRELKGLYRRFVQAVRNGLEDTARRGVIPFPGDLHGMAVVLTSIIDGMSLQFMVMPDLLQQPGVWEAAEEAIVRVLGVAP
jgi:AcrR family transcriptional regulator